METGSGAVGTSGITTESAGSGAETSGTGAMDCDSIKDGSETGSDSWAGSTSSANGGSGKSTLKELGSSLETVGGSSGREGSCESRADDNGSGSLNETSGSGVDVLDGEEHSGSGADSG